MRRDSPGARLAFSDAAGEILDEDDAAQGMAWSGTMTRVFSHRTARAAPVDARVPERLGTYGLDDEVTFGRDVLVAPMLWPGISERSVSLPPGAWVDYWTGVPFAGGRTHRVHGDFAAAEVSVEDAAPRR
jgi:hypothetical protein